MDEELNSEFLSEFNSGLPSEEELFAGLRKEFPSMRVRPLSLHGVQGHTYGAWVGGNCVMPDGLPVFDELGTYAGEDTHDGVFHTELVKYLSWLDWCVYEYRYGVYFIEPFAIEERYCALQDRESHIERNKKREEFLASRADVHYLHNYRKRTSATVGDCPF